jgi:protein SCO1/2
MKIKLWMLGLGLTALLMVGAGVWIATQPYSFHGSVIEPAFHAPDFTLTAQDNKPFHLSEQTGNVVLIFFGYTSCPDVCPTTLAEFKRVRQRLPRETDHVKFVFITVDPERDTQDKLRGYLAAFDPSFIGLTGTETQLEPVWKAYGVYREKMPGSSALAYTVNHTSQVYVIDAQGNLRLTYSYGENADDIVQDVDYLVGEIHATTARAPANSANEPVMGAATLGDLQIDQAWARASSAGMTSGAYLSITNKGAQSDALIAIQSPVAAMVEMHQTMMENNVMKMSPVTRVVIAPGQKVEFKPGGYHVMLMNINRTLAVGDRVPLILKFERAGQVQVEATVIEQ